MTADDRCHEIRELAAELALGIADGRDRARVLEHLADCADCRREVESFSAVADELLALAPAQEPPLGFELRVLRALEPPRRKRGRTARRLALVAAALLVAVGVTAGAMLLGFRDERRLAAHYRATLAQAQGSYFGADRLHDGAGEPAGVSSPTAAPRRGSRSRSHPSTATPSRRPSSWIATAGGSR